jgi:zinc protease
MILYDRFTLENGLRVIVHEDRSTPMACINILYNVGARDEDSNKTGFAHLFEHLMFGGSINIPNYDGPLQEVGGENNAFTTNDITNYYIQLPADNIETAFWLESDRMLSLAFSEKSLETQRSVVIEEFKQRYLNQPYGDAWLLLRPEAYKVHPYQWATIGKELSHIENATMEDVRAFFKRFYHPANAILAVSGKVKTAQIKELCNKWFASIPAGEPNLRNLPKEPEQTEARKLTVYRDVPADMITKAWHMSKRTAKEYQAQDLLSDIIGRGESSRLYVALVKDKPLFSDLGAYVMGSFDEGLFVVSGHLAEGVDMEEAETELLSVINQFKTVKLSEKEVNKVKHKAESTHVFDEINILNKAMNLAVGELFGDTEFINKEISKIRAVSADEIMHQANKILRDENCTTLYYRKKIQE